MQDGDEECTSGMDVHGTWGELCMGNKNIKGSTYSEVPECLPSPVDLVAERDFPAVSRCPSDLPSSGSKRRSSLRISDWKSIYKQKKHIHGPAIHLCTVILTNALSSDCTVPNPSLMSGKYIKPRTKRSLLENNHGCAISISISGLAHFGRFDLWGANTHWDKNKWIPSWKTLGKCRKSLENPECQTDLKPPHSDRKMALSVLFCKSISYQEVFTALRALVIDDAGLARGPGIKKGKC